VQSESIKSELLDFEKENEMWRRRLIKELDGELFDVRTDSLRFQVAKVIALKVLVKRGSFKRRHNKDDEDEKMRGVGGQGEKQKNSTT
jgi:hypothetical protein